MLLSFILLNRIWECCRCDTFNVIIENKRKSGKVLLFSTAGAPRRRRPGEETKVEERDLRTLIILRFVHGTTKKEINLTNTINVCKRISSRDVFRGREQGRR